jgi:hypothetical protein
MEIINQCANPPTGALWHLRKSLKWIDQSHLDGVYCIRLLDQLPRPTEQSDEEYKYARAEGHYICGIYSAKNWDTVSCITLNLGDIYRPIPRAYFWTTVPTLLIIRTLAHEVAHHLVATRGYVFKRGENFKHKEYEEVAANRYAYDVLKKMQERWYYRLGRWMIKDLADHHHVMALFDWREKKYEKSAEHWYKAWWLNPELDEAAYWYLRAKKMCSSEQEEQALN